MLDVLIDACREEAAGRVGEILQFFLEECELEQAPDANTVTQCRDILTARAGKFQCLAQMCQDWLDEQASEQK